MDSDDVSSEIEKFRWADALEDPRTPGRTRVFVEPLNGGPKRPMTFFIDGYSTVRFDHCRPGRDFVSAELLPPGRYRLTFEVRDAAIESCLVDVAHGFMSDVTRSVGEPTGR